MINGADPRHRHDNELQVEDDVNVPDSLDDKGVVAIITVPVTLAPVGPDAVFATEKVAGPPTALEKEMVDVTPPETSSSSASVNWIGVSTIVLQHRDVGFMKLSIRISREKFSKTLVS